MSAKDFISQLEAISSSKEIEKVARYFKGGEPGGKSDNKILGVSIGKIFPVARRFTNLSLSEIGKLLDSRYYEVRMGAVAIMDFQARADSTTSAQRKALFNLYMKRHDRINNWDLVDRAAPHVVGRYLMDRPRDVLFKLARSRNPWKRRTAIVSTYYFIRSGDVDDTFRIAEILVMDKHELVQKATGSWLREAGKKDQRKLVRFLNKHAAKMPRTTLRYAIERLDEKLRTKFVSLARNRRSRPRIEP